MMGLSNQVKSFDSEFLLKILCLVADTTALNTGCKKGAFKQIVHHLMVQYGIELHALECLMHVVELLFKHFFLFIDGPAKSPEKLQKDAVYNFITTINDSVPELKVMNSFEELPCSPDAREIIQRFLDSTQGLLKSS